MKNLFFSIMTLTLSLSSYGATHLPIAVCSGNFSTGEAITVSVQVKASNFCENSPYDDNAIIVFEKDTTSSNSPLPNVSMALTAKETFKGWKSIYTSTDSDDFKMVLEYGVNNPIAGTLNMNNEEVIHLACQTYTFHQDCSKN